MRNKLLRMGFAAVMAAVLAGCSFGPQPAAVEESVSSQMTEEEFVQELEELPLLVAANALPEDQLFQTADFRFYTQQDSFATYDIWQLEQCQQELAALVLGEEVTDPAQMERLSQASQEVWIYGRAAWTASVIRFCCYRMGKSIFWLLISGVGRNSVFSRWKIQITSAVWWRRPVNQLSALYRGGMYSPLLRES